MLVAFRTYTMLGVPSASPKGRVDRGLLRNGSAGDAPAPGAPLLAHALCES